MMLLLREITGSGVPWSSHWMTVPHHNLTLLSRCPRTVAVQTPANKSETVAKDKGMVVGDGGRGERRQ